MHPNPIYRKTPEARNLDFAAERGFGTLTINGQEGPLASHIPFTLGEGRVEAHIVRSNPIAAALKNGPVQALLAVTGADGYISPDWYGIEDQVPTWNYIAVHLRGSLRLVDQSELRVYLERLSDRFESALAPKPVWTMDKMTPDALERLMRMIVPVEMTIESVDGTWKLSQNKPDAAILGAAEGLAESSAGAEVRSLARLMRETAENGRL